MGGCRDPPGDYGGIDRSLYNSILDQCSHVIISSPRSLPIPPAYGPQSILAATAPLQIWTIINYNLSDIIRSAPLDLRSEDEKEYAT